MKSTFKLNVPSLCSYKENMDSCLDRLGNIPNHWRLLPGRACFQEKKIPNKEMQEKIVLSLSYGRIIKKPKQDLYGLVPESFDTYQVVDPGDIIFRPTDLQNDKVSLRFGLSNYRGIITSAYLCLKPKSLITNKYGYLLLHTYDLLKIFYGLGSGLRQNIDWKDFKYLPCLVPPLDEQNAIVHFVDYYDRRIKRYIRARQKLIKLLNEQKQAIIHQAVTRGLDPSVRLNPSGIDWLGDIPEHWGLIPLKRIVNRQNCGIKAGPFGSQLTSADMMGSEVKVYTQRNVINNDLNIGNSYINQSKYMGLKAFEVFPGDILVTSRGTIGRTLLVNENSEKGILHPCLIRIRPNLDKIIPEFLMTLIQESQLLPQQLILLSNATTIDVIYSDTLANLLLPIPSVVEQKQITDYLSSSTSIIKDILNRLSHEIILVHEYRNRLFAEVVTGKLDVRAAAAQLPEEPPELEEPEPGGGEEPLEEDLEDEEGLPEEEVEE